MKERGNLYREQYDKKYDGKRLRGAAVAKERTAAEEGR